MKISAFDWDNGPQLKIITETNAERLLLQCLVSVNGARTAVISEGDMTNDFFLTGKVSNN